MIRNCEDVKDATRRIGYPVLYKIDHLQSLNAWQYALALYFETEEERRVFAEQETKFMLRTKNTRKKCYIIVFFRPFQNFAMITRHTDIEKNCRNNKPDIWCQKVNWQKSNRAGNDLKFLYWKKIIFYLWFT